MDQTVQQVEPHNSCRNLFAVYAYLMSGLLVTALSVTIFLQVATVVSFVQDHFIITMLLTSLLITVSLSLFNKAVYPQNKNVKLIFYIIICFITGIPLLEAESDALIKSIVYTAIIVVILSLKSFLVSLKTVNPFIYPMTVLHTLVLLSTIYSILFGLVESTSSRMVTAFCLHGGFIVYSLLLICNTQRLCLSANYSRFDPLFSAVVMYMNVINLYSRVATFCSMETTTEMR